MTQHNRIEAIKTTIANRLWRGYIDGYMYHADEWQLIKLVYREKSECYYALIEVDSENPDHRTAVFEIYGFLPEVDMADSDPAHVGFSADDFPADAVEVEIGDHGHANVG